MAKVSIDFSAPSYGDIRPLHGVNSGPCTKVFTFDMSPLFREAGIPFVRLHDTEYPYGSGEFVDIPCIFKSFEADETLEQSYNFGLTDEYVRRIIELGEQPIFRLGVSIEHAPLKRYIYPPADFGKWARICEHIIRHYNEGWANGYHWNIRYWEIWNEADGGNNMWLGTPEEFYELYCVAALHLKAAFPELKIGGCGFTRPKNAFIEGFFDYITAKDVRIPLDFYSWHRYFSTVSKLREAVSDADALLQKYGYTDAENIFDEWNYVEDWHAQGPNYVKLKNHIGAAYCAAVLSVLQQDTDVDIATYFEGDVSKEWCGLFEVTKMAIGRNDRAEIGPLKPFYAFKAFNELFKIKKAVRAESDTDGIYACAAADDGHVGLMAANFDHPATELTLEMSSLPAVPLDVMLVDAQNTWTRLMKCQGGERLTLTLSLPDNAFIYIGNA